MTFPIPKALVASAVLAAAMSVATPAPAATDGRARQPVQVAQILDFLKGRGLRNATCEGRCQEARDRCEQRARNADDRRDCRLEYSVCSNDCDVYNTNRR